MKQLRHNLSTYNYTYMITYKSLSPRQVQSRALGSHSLTSRSSHGKDLYSPKPWEHTTSMWIETKWNPRKWIHMKMGIVNQLELRDTTIYTIPITVFTQLFCAFPGLRQDTHPRVEQISGRARNASVAWAAPAAVDAHNIHHHIVDLSIKNGGFP